MKDRVCQGSDLTRTPTKTSWLYVVDVKICASICKGFVVGLRNRALDFVLVNRKHTQRSKPLQSVWQCSSGKEVNQQPKHPNKKNLKVEPGYPNTRTSLRGI
eukprot:1447156-Amphidinium_carterae.1